jgi:hypothetical protein
MSDEGKDERLRPIGGKFPHFDALGLVHRLAEGKPGLRDEESLDEIAATFRNAVALSIGSPHVLHGHRTERLFASMVAGLEGVRLVKQEDAGDLVVAGPAVAAPDYRLGRVL